jgi:hypothetical protein
VAAGTARKFGVALAAALLTLLPVARAAADPPATQGPGNGKGHHSATPTPPAVAPPTTARAVLRVAIATDSALLGPDYWQGDAASAFTIRLANTGNVAAHVSVGYQLPAGVTEAAGGTGCAAGSCVVSGLSPGATATLRVAVTVGGDAWRYAPMGGLVWFVASAVGVAPVSGRTAWCLVFPPGPPAPGIGLRVGDVALGDDPAVPAGLDIRVTNTGARPAVGHVDVMVPDGVAAGTLPPACHRTDPSTVDCVVGTVPSGQVAALAVPLVADPAARARSPLAGLVKASLTPSAQPAVATQSSYRILAPIASAAAVPSASDAAVVPPKAGPASVASANGMSFMARGVVFWPIVGGAAAVLLTVLAVLFLTLRSRKEDPPPLDAPVEDPVVPPATISRALTLRWPALPRRQPSD